MPQRKTRGWDQPGQLAESSSGDRQQPEAVVSSWTLVQKHCTIAFCTGSVCGADSFATKHCFYSGQSWHTTAFSIHDQQVHERIGDVATVMDNL